VPVYYRVDGRRAETDQWEKLSKHRTVPEAREAAQAFEATGGEARIRGPGGHVITFQSLELGPRGLDALAELIAEHPEGLAPGIDVAEALRILRGGKPPTDVS
jgi:hypothetical protein